MVSMSTTEQYRRDGHTRVEGLMDAAEVAVYRPAVAAVVEQARAVAPPLAERSTYDKAFLQLMNLWRRDATIERFVRSPHLAATAAALLGVERVRLYHDQALFKEPGGGFTPWHQDAIYWPLDGNRCITMWMPLVDVVPEMGAMTFADGTHRYGALGGTVISDASEADFDSLVAERGFALTTHGAMRAGDATFHDGWTLHRATRNDTDTMRAVMTVIWFADGERVREPSNTAQRNDLVTWLPGCAPGDLAASPLNPVISDR